MLDPKLLRETPDLVRAAIAKKHLEVDVDAVRGQGLRYITGATNNPLVITNASLLNEGLYSVVVSNAAGTASSSNASLTIVRIPFFITPPVSQTNLVGQNTNFTVVAGGTAPLSYQWLFNGTALTGQTNATLNLTNLQLTNGGLCTIIVPNPYGSATNPATETIAAGYAMTQGRFGRIDAATAFSGRVVTGSFLSSTLDDLRSVERGCIEGYHVEDWLQAETEVDHLLLNPLPK